MSLSGGVRYSAIPSISGDGRVCDMSRLFFDVERCIPINEDFCRRPFFGMQLYNRFGVMPAELRQGNPEGDDCLRLSEGGNSDSLLSVSADLCVNQSPSPCSQFVIPHTFGNRTRTIKFKLPFGCHLFYLSFELFSNDQEQTMSRILSADDLNDFITPVSPYRISH
jgi:hypothetical protein